LKTQHVILKVRKNILRSDTSLAVIKLTLHTEKVSHKLQESIWLKLKPQQLKEITNFIDKLKNGLRDIPQAVFILNLHKTILFVHQKYFLLRIFHNYILIQIHLILVVYLLLYLFLV